MHHNVAKSWFDNLDLDSRVCFCRFTQLSLLRLLTTQAVMGQDEVMTQAEAWEAYDRWKQDGRIAFLEEPLEIELSFRSRSSDHHPRAKNWADAYLAAFAAVSGMQLVTFDRAFQGKLEKLLILKS
jgi:toxin-antitoxin system PIN domain toxin